MGNPVVHFEINGADGPALERFYSGLFGWHVQPMPEMRYGLVDTHAGEGINGGIGQTEDGRGVVQFYVEGPDIQVLLDRAESLGGKPVTPVTEVPGVVTFAHLADPFGNVIGLVKADGSEEGGVSPGANPPVAWFEIQAPDTIGARRFYSDLFGWKINVHEEWDYGEVDTGAGRGISGGIGPTPDGAPHASVWAKVDDLQRYLDRAESLGAKVVMAPMKMGEGLAIAGFTDPQGNFFGLFRMGA
ncbi:MAG: VOC family protein [Acidobacteria bacterium]|nr:VOC family protein [Acidobacteriota bacterium]